MITVNTLTCPNCGSVIFSRAVHDWRACPCKSIFVDGGFEYLRWGELKKLKGEIVQGTLEVPQTKQELYNDWNSGGKKFGIIKPSKEKK